jgi:hypothetical protein
MNTAGGPKRAYLDDVNGAIRENPLAAGLIGLGLIGMFVSRRKLGRMAAPIPGLAKSAATGMGNVAGSGMDQLRGGASAAVDAAESAKESIVETTKRFASALAPDHRGDYYSSASSPEQWSAPFQSSNVDFGPLRQKVTDACEQQPLLIGMAGLAVGAAVAAAFKPTELERDFLGDSAASLREQASAAIAEAKSRAARAAEAMQDEAAAQGFTASNAKAQAKAAAQKAADVAKATFSSSSE